MEELKITVHTHYTYETSDGKEFDNKQEAMKWQKHLNVFNTICMLTAEYKPTTDIEDAIYVHAKTQEQAEAFNAITLEYFSFGATLNGTGWFRYDDVSYSYIEIESEIEKLQHIIDVLNKGGVDNA